MAKVLYIEERASEERNRVFLKSLETGIGPDAFIWRAADHSNKKLSPYALDAVRAKEAHADSLRVSRDVMGCCGVRADIHNQYGCRR